jgi:plastocyanin
VRKATLALLTGAALLSAVPANGAARKTVEVGDNYFMPKKLTVARNTTVVWRWPGLEEAGDVHDVKLTSGPKGVKKFQSEAASTEYTYRRKLTKAGTYKLVCTLHHEMRMTIKVKR